MRAKRTLGALLVTTLATTYFASLALGSGGAIKGFLRIDPTGGDSTGFGRAVAEIADLDGDGVKDVAVGAPNDDNGNPDPDTNLGAIWILFMNADGTVKARPAPQKLLSPFVPADGHEFARNLAWLGDLDSTHRNALAVAAPAETEAVSIAFLSYSGGTVTATYQDVGLPPERCLPHSLAPIGDFDNDGVPDLAVGNGCVGANQGAVYVVLLNANGTKRSCTQIGPSGFSPPLDGLDELGVGGIAWLGDLDATHRRALAVGAYQDEVLGSNTGVVYILFLNTDGTVNSYQKIGNGGAGLPPGTLPDGNQFGSALAALGDLDGDGKKDLSVGASQYGYNWNPSSFSYGSVINLFLNADGTVKDFQRIIDRDYGDGRGPDGCLPCTLSQQDYFGSFTDGGPRCGDGVGPCVESRRFRGVRVPHAMRSPERCR